jgi:hypothetical protein
MDLIKSIESHGKKKKKKYQNFPFITCFNTILQVVLLGENIDKKPYFCEKI